MARKLLRSPLDMRSVLAHKYNRHVTTWLIQPERASYSMSLGLPPAQVAKYSPENVQRWAQDWAEENAVHPEWDVQYATPSWNNENFTTLPARVTAMGPVTIARLIGKEDDWYLLRERYNELYNRFSGQNPDSATIIADAIKKSISDIRKCPEKEFLVILDEVERLRDNKDSHESIRHTLEKHQWMVHYATFLSNLVEAARACAGKSGGRDIGITAPPRGMRWVHFLDEKIRPAGIRSFMAEPKQLAALTISPKVVLLCESQYCLYALPDLPQTVAIHTGSQDIDTILDMQWVKDATIVYWGSIDTYNFERVDLIRSKHPRVKTVLMNSSILLKYEDKWDVEAEASLERLPHLIPLERETCSFILHLGSCRYSSKNVQKYVKQIINSWGTIQADTATDIDVYRQQVEERMAQLDNIKEPHFEDNSYVCAVRLDQDKISWDEALSALRKTIKQIVDKD